MPLVKKKKPQRKVLIGHPQEFRKEPLPLELQHQLETPSLRGGCNVGLRTGSAIGVRWDEENLTSVRTLRHPVRKNGLPEPTQDGAPVVSYRRTESAGSILHPLRMNPQICKAASPIFELDAHEAKLVDHPVVRSQINRTKHTTREILSQDGWYQISPETNIALFSSSDKDTTSLYERVSPFPLSSSQLLPIAETDERTPECESRVQMSQLLSTALPIEMCEPREIYQHYRATNNIKVDVCPQAVDDGDQFTWTHCWGLLNLYTFAVCSRDIEFADRVIDLIRDSLAPAKAPDRDTLQLLFTSDNISSRLKLLAADWYVSDSSKSFHYKVSQTLPRSFLAFGIQAIKEHGHIAGWSPEPCRYHRHLQSEHCYLRRWVQERDRRVVLNRKARKSRLASGLRADAEPCTSTLPLFCDKADTEACLDDLEDRSIHELITKTWDIDCTNQVLHEEKKGGRLDSIRTNRSKSLISRLSGRRSPIINCTRSERSTMFIDTPKETSGIVRPNPPSSGSIGFFTREENTSTMSLRNTFAYNTLPGSYPESSIDI